MPLGIAYREWLLGLARVEADAGCPRLFAMKSDIAMYFADITRDWEPERRYHLMCANIKLLCDKNYGFPPIPLTEGETAAAALFDYPYVLRWRSPSKPHAQITWRTTGVKTVVDADKVDAAYRYEQAMVGMKLDKKLLKSTLREFMQRDFGRPEVNGPGWSFTSHVPGLKILTMLDFGGRRPTQLQYSHWVYRVKGERDIKLMDTGGIDALLGWPQTRWRYLTNEDIPAAADLLVRLCKEFVEAVPGMWERSGLGT
jgi:hypothetical protein